MTHVTAFDGSTLATAAPARASDYGTAQNRPVVVTVVPRNTEYARKKDWIDDGDSFDLDTVVDRIRSRVERVAPEAETVVETTDSYAQPGTIASQVREVANEVDASVVFVGPEDAGGFVAPVTSVGSGIAAEDDYDVHIVRRPRTERPER